MIGPCVVGGGEAGPTVAVGNFVGVIVNVFVGVDGGFVVTGGCVSAGGDGVSVSAGGDGSSGVFDGVNTGGVEVPDDGPCPGGGGGATGTVVVNGGGATVESTGGSDVTAGIVVVTGTSDGAAGGGALLGGGANTRGIWVVGAGADLVMLAGANCALRWCSQAMARPPTTISARAPSAIESSAPRDRNFESSSSASGPS